MHDAALAASLNVIRSTADAAGIQLPDELEQILAEADALQQSPLAAPNRSAVARTVAAAIRNGDDPAGDPEVLAALTRHQLAEAVPTGALADAANELRQQALNDAADTIYSRLHDVVAQADQTIATAREKVPHLDPFDPKQPPSLNPDGARRWVEARDATLLVEQALKCWTLLTSACDQRGSRGGGRYGDVLRVADLTADQLDTILTARPDFRDVIAAGHRLDLATPAQHRQRVEAVRTQRQRQQQQRDNAFRDAYRRTHAIVMDR